MPFGGTCVPSATGVLTRRSCTAFGLATATGTASSRGNTSATASVVTTLVSRNSDGVSRCRSSHGGTLSDNGNFNDQLAAAIGATELAKHHAVLFKPDDGNLTGTTFLIIDANGKAGYQAGKDFVVLLTDAAHLGQLDAGDFVVAT